MSHLTNRFDVDDRPNLSKVMAKGRPTVVTGGPRYRDQLGRMADLMNLICWKKFLENVTECEVILSQGRHNQEPTILVESQRNDRLRTESETCEVWADQFGELHCTCNVSKSRVNGDFDQFYCFGMCLHTAAVMFQDRWHIIIRSGPSRSKTWT